MEETEEEIPRFLCRIPLSNGGDARGIGKINTEPDVVGRSSPPRREIDPPRWRRENPRLSLISNRVEGRDE